MKTILMSVMAIAIVVGVVGAGTFAYFSDTETSSGNTFTAGILDLELDDNNEDLGRGYDFVTDTWILGDMKPGVHFREETLSIHNKGNVVGDHLEISTSNTVTGAGVPTDMDEYLEIAEMGYHPYWMANVIAAANRLVATQNNDGGWEWTDPNLELGDTSPGNTFGVTGKGLIYAYKLTDVQGYLDAAEVAGTAILGWDDLDLYPQDIYLLAELWERTSNSAYRDKARSALVAKSQYYMTQYPGAANGAQATRMYYELVKRLTLPNVVAWDMGSWAEAAQAIGFAWWADDMAAEIVGVYGGLMVLPGGLGDDGYYYLGLAGALRALVEVAPELNVDGGYATEIAAIAGTLSGAQDTTGYWEEGIPLEPSTQTTGYGAWAMGLAGYSPEAKDAADWLASAQLLSGGWGDVGGPGENTEVTSEVLCGLFYAASIRPDDENLNGIIDLDDLENTAGGTGIDDLKPAPGTGGTVPLTMRVRFHEDAGNPYQGGEVKMEMTVTLNQDATQ